jgi:hypothetical protein
LNEIEKEQGMIYIVEWERNHNKKCEEVKGFLMGSTMGND